MGSKIHSSANGSAHDMASERIKGANEASVKTGQATTDICISSDLRVDYFRLLVSYDSKVT